MATKKEKPTGLTEARKAILKSEGLKAPTITKLEVRYKGLSQARIRQLEHKRHGICTRCTEKLASSRFCKKHLEQFRAKVKAKAWAKKDKKAKKSA